METVANDCFLSSDHEDPEKYVQNSWISFHLLPYPTKYSENISAYQLKSGKFNRKHDRKSEANHRNSLYGYYK